MLAINDDRTIRLLVIFSLVAATAYLMLSVQQPQPIHVVLKTALCLFLAAAAWRAHQRLLVLALLFSAGGDALLGIDAGRLFVPGLVCFLVTHLLYSAIFLRAPASWVAAPGPGRKALGVLIVVFAVGFVFVLWPVLGTLRWPVLAYVAVITGMSLLSLRMKSVLLPLGAVLFMASDSLIALSKFLWSADWIGPTIWISYAAAQLLIVCGLLTSGRPQDARVAA